MDIALVVEHLVPGAKYRRCATYQELEDTWTDARPIPTESELSDAEADAMADAAALTDRPTPQEIAEALLEADSNPALDSLRTRLAAAKTVTGE